MFGPPRKCPACPSTQFHRSRRTKLRFVLKTLCVQPFRCDSCGYRVWRFNPLGTTAAAQRPQPTPVG
jgi:C4-type Zn-finger protein